MADQILTDIVKPISRKLLSTDLIYKWFFIRYNDPEPHLRIRFHYSGENSLNKIISELNHPLKALIEKNLIWKVQIDTYQREIERYGHACMELVEEIFYFDSEMMIKIIDLLDGDEGESIRWHFAIKSVDMLLNDFGLELEAKLSLLTSLKENYANEFSMNRNLKRQIDIKYRKELQGIKDAIEGDYFNPQMQSPLNKRSVSNRPIIKKILDQYIEDEREPGFISLLLSIIHMSMNRIFISGQRKHELVIYDFLFKYYKSALARRKYSKKNID